jgi:two-component system nitrogen regulation response regulator NtrX
MNKIIIIDDEKEICESIKMILEYEDYHVEYFTESISGLRRLEETTFNALLLDIQMPGLNGFEVLKSINDKNLMLNVIMISAFSSLENAVKATKLGAFDFIEKPIDRNKLIISVRNAVEKTKLVIENKKLKEDLTSGDEILGESEIN